jgi:glyoxylase-like metal-dependent hydrolase (beta-lactamase superfamily II)
MARKLWLLAGVIVGVAGCSTTPRTASTVLQAAQTAMGNVTSIQYSGTGMNAFVGQALTAGEEWPRRDLSSFSRTINYEQSASREELNFAQPTFGGQQQNAQVSGDLAWNIGPAGPVPQVAAAEGRQLQILLTPHGFVRAALAAGNATLSGTEGASVISFTARGNYPLQGTFDAQNLLTKIETKRPDPVLGDADVVAAFSDYKDFNGVKFPGKILITEGGFPSWDLTITNVTPNAPLEMPVPEAVQAATVPPVETASVKLANGVWHVTGGSHHSVVVEFNDYVAVVEAPLSEERSVAVLEEAKKLAPNKPVKYVLTTHHHFDHIGGLRTYVAEGATVVTHASNVPYFEKILTAPATVVPDRQGKAQKPPMLQGVSEKYVMTDGKQTIEVYPTPGDTHTKEYTFIYLPGPKILVEADAFSPGPPDAPPPATPPANAVALYDEIQRLKLNVSTIAPIHGRGAVPIAELRKFIGKRS